MIVREGYHNVMKRELKKAGIKALIFPMIMLILFIIFVISGPGLTLDIPENATMLTMLPWGSSLSYQFLMVIFVLISQWCFSLFLIFLTFSIIPFVKKFYLVLLYSFISINLFNYIISIIGKSIFTITNIYPENVYEVMMTDSILRTLVTLPLCLIVSIVIYFIVYRNKDKVVLKRD